MNARELVLASSVVATAWALGCVNATDEDAASSDAVDTGDVSDTAADAGSGDAGSDAGSGEPAVVTNISSTTWAEPAACAASNDLALPIEITGCDYTFDPPPWQQTSSGGTSGLIDLRSSCAGSSADAPANVHVTFPRSDASGAAAVLWMTDAETMQTELQLGTTPDALDRWAQGFSFTYALIAEERRVHEVHLCGLEANTTYYYRVGGGGQWSDVYAFTTAPEPGDDETFIFAATGDSRSTTQAMWGQTLDSIEALGADFLVFTGDAVEIGTLQPQWDVWWDQASATETTSRLASLPMLYAHGNHDLVGDPMWAMMAYPDDEQSYWVRYGNTLFIVLDDSGTFRTGKRIEDEIRDFLIEAIEANPDARWRIVAHHKPAYSASTNHGSNGDIIEAWVPVFEEYDVDLVLNGHDHNYERSCYVNGGACASTGDGTVYVVTAGIGAPLYGNGSDWWTRISASRPNYVQFTVTPEQISAVAYDPTTGTEVDRFTIE